MDVKNLICALTVPFAFAACKPDFPVSCEIYSNDRVKDAVVFEVGKKMPQYDHSTYYVYLHYDYWKEPRAGFAVKDAWQKLLFINEGGDHIADYPTIEEAHWLPGEPEGICRKLELVVDWDRGEEYAIAAFCSGDKSKDMENAEAWAKKMQELFSKKYK